VEETVREVKRRVRVVASSLEGWCGQWCQIGDSATIEKNGYRSN